MDCGFGVLIPRGRMREFDCRTRMLVVDTTVVLELRHLNRWFGVPKSQ